MITATQILSNINEALGDDRHSFFIRGKDSIDFRTGQSLDSEDYVEWTDSGGVQYALILEKISVEPSRRIILRIKKHNKNEDYGYCLLNDYPSLPEVLYSYGRLIRGAKELGIEGISYPNEEVWEKLHPPQE